MRTKCQSIATFHSPIHSHWSLPLMANFWLKVLIIVPTKKSGKTNFPPLLLPLLDPGSEMDKNQDGMILSRILVPSLTCPALLTMLIVQQCFHYTVLLMISMFCHSESITCGSSRTVIEKELLCKTNVIWGLWNHKCKASVSDPRVLLFAVLEASPGAWMSFFWRCLKVVGNQN